MTTEYRVQLDRGACEGIFACLVRDGRFAEAADGLATLDGAAADGDGSNAEADASDDTVIAAFDDDRVDDARQAARACPVGAIEVLEGDG
jgi:ferredoxin